MCVNRLKPVKEFVDALLRNRPGIESQPAVDSAADASPKRTGHYQLLEMLLM